MRLSIAISIDFSLIALGRTAAVWGVLICLALRRGTLRDRPHFDERRRWISNRNVARLCSLRAPESTIEPCQIQIIATCRATISFQSPRICRVSCEFVK